jgi:hypothetical protein
MPALSLGMTAAAPARTARLPRVSAPFFWIFLALSILMFLDPTNPGYRVEGGNLRLPREFGPIKYVAIFLFGYPALLFAAAGAALNHRGAQAREIGAAVRGSWPIFLFALFIFCGSLYARLGKDIADSFLPASISMTSFWVALFYLCESSKPERIVRAYFFLLFAATPFMIWEMLDRWIHGGHAFHEEIFLLVPLAVYGFQRSRTNLARWAWVGVTVAVSVLSYKNTSYMVGLGTIVYALTSRPERSARPANGVMQLFVGLLGSLVVLAIIVIGAYLVFHYRDALPSGSTDVRIYMYQSAWENFLASPIYGMAFSGSSHGSFLLFPIFGHYEVGTHSDLMDVLAQGGVVGFVIAAAAYIAPLRLSRVPRELDAHASACIHGMRAIHFAGCVVMLFNPVAVNYPLSTMLWFNAGLLVGLAQYYRARAATGQTLVRAGAHAIAAGV